MLASGIKRKRLGESLVGGKFKKPRRDEEWSDRIRTRVQSSKDPKIFVIIEGYEIESNDSPAERQLKEKVIRRIADQFFMDGCPQDRGKFTIEEDKDTSAVEYTVQRGSSTGSSQSRDRDQSRGKADCRKPHELYRGTFSLLPLQYLPKDTVIAEDEFSQECNEEELHIAEGSSCIAHESNVDVLSEEERAGDKLCFGQVNRVGSQQPQAPPIVALLPATPPGLQTLSATENASDKAPPAAITASTLSPGILASVEHQPLLKRKVVNRHRKPVYPGDDKLASRFHEVGFIPVLENACFKNPPIQQFLPFHRKFTYMHVELKKRGYGIKELVWLWGRADLRPPGCNAKALGMRLARFKGGTAA